MDPNANLQEQREITGIIKTLWDSCNSDGTLSRGNSAAVAEQAERLAELVDELDCWIRKSGFLPDDWKR